MTKPPKVCKRCSNAFNSMGVCPQCGEGPSVVAIVGFAVVALVFASGGACCVQVILEANSDHPHDLSVPFAMFSWILLPIWLAGLWWIVMLIKRERKG